MNDILLNKQVSIERCIKQIRSYYQQRSREIEFQFDYLTQDTIDINLQRMAELAIDIANHIRRNKLGIPQSSADSFDILYRHQLISEQQCGQLQGVVGFRNILVHEY